MEVTTLVGMYDSNTFITSTPKGTLIIDCGADLENITKTLQKHPKPWNLLLTHGHIDHMLNAAPLQKLGAKVYIHTLDAERLTSDRDGDKYKQFGVEFCPEYTTFEDGDVLKLSGFSIEVIHTPGHTQGSVCFMIEGEMFAGDTLFFEDYGRTDLYGGNFEQMKASLHHLFTLDPDIKVYTGHYRTTTIGHEAKKNPIHF